MVNKRSFTHYKEQSPKWSWDMNKTRYLNKTVIFPFNCAQLRTRSRPAELIKVGQSNVGVTKYKVLKWQKCPNKVKQDPNVQCLRWPESIHSKNECWFGEECRSWWAKSSINEKEKKVVLVIREWIELQSSITEAVCGCQWIEWKTGLQLRKTTKEVMNHN